ncbi:8-oxo-dGTP diphosphatase [Catenuloplanes nepalensis]|uniref:8-oxo-dGTP diphosphatase n=1 Tax=Catenuloplanes nepalensis TaxID=587533 RepID=A0ABT9MJT1_9ACTN|nr:NUDIX domain-containing protein [Catenuloplanes nepalensis]MDP9791678.1 8-oxo-dGTP diphosphatase [Catenuloplanes nepalensis]
MSEAEFLAAYDPRDYPAVAVTVDVVALTIRDDRLCVLLVERAAPPFEGFWSLPGGFLKQRTDDGEAYAETLEEAAGRELAEETGLDAVRLDRVHLEQLGSYGDPGRDPRMRVISVAYLGFGPQMPDPEPGSDARAAAWVPVADLGLPEGPDAIPGRTVSQRPGTSRRLAFDHAQILFDGLERARGKLEYTALATAFVGDTFTIAELRAVYETVWGEQLHGPNFRRKILSVPGFVESVGATTERGGARGGPRSQLYRAGDATLLHPALLRTVTEEQIR